MKKSITLLCVLALNKLFACDVCGCFMGITPYDNHSSISMMYRYKSFNGYPNTIQNNYLFPSKLKIHSSNYYSPNTYTNTNQYNTLKHGSHTSPTDTLVPQHSQQDYELYTSAELRAKFFIHKRIELNVIVPFIMNSSKMDSEVEHIQGIGDITFFVAYHLISRTMTEKFQHRLILGGGIKIACW